MPSQAAWYWSRAQWGEVELGDARRQRRAVAGGVAFADASARSLPQQHQSRAAAEATCRLMDCEDVTHGALIEPHLQASRQAAQACGRNPVLFVQDGSQLDFTHRNSLEGVGRIGNDRGADVYAPLARARALGWYCLVRACQARELADGGYLLQQVRALEPMSQRTVRVRVGKKGPKKRQLQVAWCAVQLRPPQGLAGRGLPPEGLPVWVIRVWDEKVEWVLVSTLPVEDAEAAAERIDWYSRRWTIEDYHKGLKTGCRIEASQLRTAERLGALLGIAALAAVRLLQLRDRARQAPGAPVGESLLSQKC